MKKRPKTTATFWRLLAIFSLTHCSTSAYSQSVDSTAVKSSIFIGLGGGGSGFALDAGIVYKWVGIGISASYADKLSEPATTDAYPSEFLSSSTSSTKQYDVGYTSYDLLGVLPITSSFSIQGNVGYYSHDWVKLTTTTDDDHILSTAIVQTATGTYASGISWGAGIQFNVSPTIMVGVSYSSINAILANAGWRFR